MLLDAGVLDDVVLDGDVESEDVPPHSGSPGGRYVSDDDIDLVTTSSYAVFARVWVEDANGIMRDYATRGGRNWIHSLHYEQTIDAPIGTATVKLLRESKKLSLAPFKTDSLYNNTPFLLADLSAGTGPALDAGRRVVIETASVPLGTRPEDLVAADWHMVFEGSVDSVDSSQPQIVLECRDKGAQLADVWFPVPNIVSSDAGNIQGALAQLLDLGHLDEAVTLYVPVAPDPEILVGQFRYDIEPVMDALQRVAGVNGWDLRYRFIDAFQNFQLTFQDPGRTKTVPDFVFGARSYIDVKTLKIDRIPIRNDFSLSYRPDNDTGVDRVTVYDYSPESVRRYGRRSMNIQEADDSPINNADSAALMLSLIKFDLSAPEAEQQVEMLYCWFVELQNLIRFIANHVHSDTDLDLGVVGISHTLSDQQTRTTLTCRGRPGGSYWNWLGRRPVVPGGGVPIDPDAPSDATGIPALAQEPDYALDQIEVLWSWTGDPTATFDVYLQQGKGGFSLAGSTSAGTFNLVVPLAVDIEPFHLPPDPPQIPIDIAVYVQALVSGSVVATSRTNTASYGFGP